MPLQRKRREGRVLDKPVMGSVHKSLPKGIRYEDYQPSSSEDTDTKSDVQKLIPKATENFYTNRLFGEPLTNYYSVEPILDESKLDKRELESNVRDDLVLIAKEYRAKAGQQNVKLGDILTVPMQRILKYHLLLKQLLDNTPPGDEDVPMLDMAYETMKDVSDYVNEGKRDHEIIAVIRLIQSKIPNFPAGEQCLQFGRLLQDGQVKMVESANGLKPKSRYVFLFEKVLLISKSKDEEIRSTYMVSNFKIVEPEQESQLNRSSNTLTRKLTTSLFDYTSLMVLIKDPCILAGDPQPYLQFIFRSAHIRNNWREMLEGAIEKNTPQKARRLRHKVSYQTFPSPTECNVCNKLLLGLFYQGYHCQTCNKNMHYACLDLGQAVCRQPTAGPPLLHRSNSSGTTHILMHPTYRFECGDRLQALQNVNSPDAAVLSFQKGDFIEVVQENADGSITGRLLNSPSNIGILSRDSVRRIPKSQTIIRTNNNNSPMRISDQNANRLSVSAMGEQTDNKRPSLVSSEIIILFDGVANLSVEQYPWYFGELERQEAKLNLGVNPDGTFLVRKSKNQLQYVLSVLYNNNDKHIKIEMEPGTHFYYLHGGRYFHNIPSLINFYRTQSLEEGFTDLFTPLKGTPLRNTVFRAVHAYHDVPTDSTRYLRLEKDDLVRVLDTNGEENGWWKGISKGVTGYFPLAYVEENTSGDVVGVEINEVDPQSTEVY